MNSTADGSVSHDRSRPLAVVITDDHRLASGDAFLGKRHDQGAELGVGAIEARLVKVACMATGGTTPHPATPPSSMPRYWGWSPPRESVMSSSPPRSGNRYHWSWPGKARASRDHGWLNNLQQHPGHAAGRVPQCMLIHQDTVTHAVRLRPGRAPGAGVAGGSRLRRGLYRQGLWQARVDRQPAIKAQHGQHPQDTCGRHHQPQLGTAGGGSLVGHHQRVDSP